MLETTIAVAILGIGLIMVAAVFPVALTQHQNSAEQAGAMELLTKAEAMLRARLDTAQLFTPSPSEDSPWFLLPTININAGGTAWDAMPQNTVSGSNLFANLISSFPFSGGVPLGNFPDYVRCLPWSAIPLAIPVDQPLTRGFLFPDLVVNRDFSPVTATTDQELQEAPSHFVWYGFYRRLASGGIRFGAAVCKQRRGQVYFEQDTATPPISCPSLFAEPKPTPASPNRRLPVPWRLTVGLDSANGRRLTNTPTPQVFAPAAGFGLGSLAPIGSKIMIQGTPYPNLGSGFAVPVPTGRIYTVMDVIDSFTVQVLEDVSDLPPFATTGTTFDVWLFPPAAGGAQTSNEAPLMAWRTNL
jgi:hypothetical protein